MAGDTPAALHIAATLIRQFSVPSAFPSLRVPNSRNLRTESNMSGVPTGFPMRRPDLTRPSFTLSALLISALVLALYTPTLGLLLFSDDAPQDRKSTRLNSSH